MGNASFKALEEFNNERVVTKKILETSYSKEIQILMKKGQSMKEHKAPFPIIVHVLEGEIEFGLSGKINQLRGGDILTLEGNIPHDLFALEDSIVRLSISKKDRADRVKSVTSGKRNFDLKTEL